MIRSEFVGKWSPATSGEKLLHLLATQVPSLRTQADSMKKVLDDVPRGPSFALFIQGSIVLHAFSRLMQASKHYRGEHHDRPERIDMEIRHFLVDKLNVDKATCPAFDQLISAAVAAAEKSSEASRPTKRFRADVIREAKGDVYCYSCGGSLDSRISQHDNSDYMDIEHVWPHSMGGDTALDNLLPVCTPCNSTRGHLASWEWSRVQAPIHGPLGEEYLGDKQTSKEEKIALHARAALEYARVHGCTLKAAYRSIGPRNAVRLLDPSDSCDFFNLYAHNPERHEATWGSLL